jgi:hypothetical protein
VSILVTADFVPVFIFLANLYTGPGSIFIVVTPSVVITSSLVIASCVVAALRPPVATDGTMI